MKKKKRIGILAGILAGLQMFGLTVRADVIWEPDDEFYRAHSEQCESVNRTFTLNGKNGEVIVYQSPDSSKRVAGLVNGTKLTVSFSYEQEGKKWGAVSFVVDEEKKVHDTEAGNALTGWVDMAELEVVYDEWEFKKEHQEEFGTYSGELKGYTVKNGMHLWEYPGAGEVKFTIPEGTTESEVGFSDTYTDELGRKWGYIGYYMAMKGWVCLDDPENADLEPVEQGEPEPGQEGERKTGNGKVENRIYTDGWKAAAVLVVVVVILTGIFVKIFWKKK